MSEQAKTITNVKILHEDDFGYGPEGDLKRCEWRDECLKKLKTGKENFKKWQQEIIQKNISCREKKVDIPDYPYEADFYYSDGSRQLITNHQSLLQLDFVCCRFDEDLTFEGYDFLIGTTFDGATFNGILNFKNTTFCKSVTFVYATFHRGAWFHNVIFKKNAQFEHANFLVAQFNGATFNERVEFRGATFKRIGQFDNTIFEKQVDFRLANFNSQASFNCASFKEAVEFNYAHFKSVEFIGSTFNKVSKFSNASFNDAASFSNTIFGGDAIFSGVSFKSKSDFQSIKFTGISDFENAVFSNVGHFEGAMFNAENSKIPAFVGCKIGDTRLQFSDDTHFTQNDHTEVAINNISFLKRLADEHGQTDQALNFNAMELRAKRKHFGGRLKPVNHVDAKHLATHLSWQLWIRGSNFFSGTFWFCVFTWVYEKVSDFGRSFTKPLFWLLVLMAISFVFGWVSALCHPPKTAPQNPLYSLASCIKYPQEKDDFISISGYRAATEYSLYRAGNFLDFTDSDKNTKSVNMRLFGSEIEPWWARIFGFFKGIITAILLFLTALGLRNKYRVG